MFSYIFAGLSILIGFGLSALLVGAAGLYWHRLRSFQGVAQTTIVEMKGPAKVHGSINSDEAVPIPFVKQNGVYYHVLFELERVTEKVFNKEANEWKYITNWETAFEATKSIPAVLADETGEADLDLAAADVILKKEEHNYEKTEKSLPATWIKRFPALREVNSKNVRAWRCRMEYLSAGDEILVTGMALKGKKGNNPKLIGGETQLVVSDLAADELEKHYKKIILFCCLASPVGALVGCLLGGAAFYFAR